MKRALEKIEKHMYIVFRILSGKYLAIITYNISNYPVVFPFVWVGDTTYLDCIVKRIFNHRQPKSARGSNMIQYVKTTLKTCRLF